MIMLYKKGPRKDYRGIALLSCILKLFKNIMASRLVTWAEKNQIIPEYQRGLKKQKNDPLKITFSRSVPFRKFILGETESFIYIVFVDMQRAFDSTDHSLLWLKLLSLGVSGKMIRIFTELYRSARLFIRDRGKLSKGIPVTAGVLQGESLSPILFSLFLADLDIFFRNKGLSGLRIDTANDALILAYADDLVILADPPSDVRNKLRVLE